ncbi:hypothetical protein ACPC36_33015 [Streptomyces pseudogriseolus]
MPASEAGGLMAGAQCEVVELDGMVPAFRGALWSRAAGTKG